MILGRLIAQLAAAVDKSLDVVGIFDSAGDRHTIIAFKTNRKYLL
jgi:hypothetical protein